MIAGLEEVLLIGGDMEVITMSDEEGNSAMPIYGIYVEYMYDWNNDKGEKVVVLQPSGRYDDDVKFMEVDEVEEFLATF
jgi:hypothetical protein